jgi:hypothetical protein
MSNKARNLAPLPACMRCDALVGEWHELGCQMEGCPYCGGQLLLCLWFGCPAVLSDPPDWSPPQDDRIPWDGLGLGVKECLEFGFLYPGPTVSGDPCEPDLFPDLNRLLANAVWSRRRKRFVLPKGGKKRGVKRDPGQP